MPNIIPKSSTWIVVIAGFAFIALTPVLLGSNFVAQFNRPLFVVVFILGCLAMLYTAYRWLITLREPAYEFLSGRMFAFLLAFAITFCWSYGWSSQYKQDKIDHIQYK